MIVIFLEMKTLGGGDDPLLAQIATGEGFLADAPDDMAGEAMGAGMALAKGLMSKKKRGKKSGALGALAGGGSPAKAVLSTVLEAIGFRWMSRPSSSRKGCDRLWTSPAGRS